MVLDFSQPGPRPETRKVVEAAHSRDLEASIQHYLIITWWSQGESNPTS